MLGALTGSAQGVRDLVINELLVKNVDNLQDDYGHRVSWVELFNSGYSKVNLASCYLIIESEGTKISYKIPKNDSRTWVAPQEYVVFYCEGTGSKGTFHTNFTLSMGESYEQSKQRLAKGDSSTLWSNQSKWISLYLVDANGRDTIDKVTYNVADQQTDVSVGRLADEDGIMHFIPLSSTTPNATNITEEVMPKHEKMRLSDPAGGVLTITAMSVVFSSLIMLSLAFYLLSKITRRMMSRRKERAAVSLPVTEEVGKMLTGEEIAAIAMALKMYQDDLHDIESTVITINRVAKVYSPWSSKLYGMTPMPERRRR